MAATGYGKPIYFSVCICRVCTVLCGKPLRTKGTESGSATEPEESDYNEINILKGCVCNEIQ